MYLLKLLFLSILATSFVPSEVHAIKHRSIFDSYFDRHKSSDEDEDADDEEDDSFDKYDNNSDDEEDDGFDEYDNNSDDEENDSFDKYDSNSDDEDDNDESDDRSYFKKNSSKKKQNPSQSDQLVRKFWTDLYLKVESQLLSFSNNKNLQNDPKTFRKKCLESIKTEIKKFFKKIPKIKEASTLKRKLQSIFNKIDNYAKLEVYPSMLNLYTSLPPHGQYSFMNNVTFASKLFSNADNYSYLGNPDYSPRTGKTKRPLLLRNNNFTRYLYSNLLISMIGEVEKSNAKCKAQALKCLKSSYSNNCQVNRQICLNKDIDIIINLARKLQDAPANWPAKTMASPQTKQDPSPVYIFVYDILEHLTLILTRMTTKAQLTPPFIILKDLIYNNLDEVGKRKLKDSLGLKPNQPLVIAYDPWNEWQSILAHKKGNRNVTIAGSTSNQANLLSVLKSIGYKSSSKSTTRRSLL